MYSTYLTKNENIFTLIYPSANYLQKKLKKPIYKGKLGCALTFFRLIVNEFSTGLCILASAFIRYCLICLPTSDILAGNRLKALSAGLVVAIITLLAFNVWDMSINFRPTQTYQHDYDYDDYYDYDYDYGLYADSKLPRFVFNCANFALRQGSKN